MTAHARRRFVIEGPLRVGAARLDAEEAGHMRVMRLEPGARLSVVDGRGGVGEATLERLGSRGADIRVESVRAAAAPPLQVWLVQALPTKLPRMDTIVRLATELGVHRIVPVVAEYTVLPGGGAQVLARRHLRWQRVAAAAGKQSTTPLLPQIDEPVRLGDLSIEDLPAPRLLLDPAAPAGALESTLREAAPPQVTLLIGPEGGWSHEEMARFRRAETRPVGLGPRVLRADTAGAVVATAVQAAWGDLR